MPGGGKYLELNAAFHQDRCAVVAGAMPILVEGPLDRLAVRRATDKLAVVAVASLGTAFTDHQALQLADAVDHRRPVAVALDPDTAGRRATIRAGERLTDAGFINLATVVLPDGRDPADLIRSGHDQHLRDALASAQPLSLAVADHRIAAAGTLDHLQKRYAVLQHILDHDLSRIPIDQISPYLGHLTHQLHLDHQTVTAAALDHLAPGRPWFRPSFDRPPSQPAARTLTPTERRTFPETHLRPEHQ